MGKITKYKLINNVENYVNTNYNIIIRDFYQSASHRNSNTINFEEELIMATNIEFESKFSGAVFFGF